MITGRLINLPKKSAFSNGYKWFPNPAFVNLETTILIVVKYGVYEDS